jgi:hypothetical protein
MFIFYSGLHGLASTTGIANKLDNRPVDWDEVPPEIEERRVPQLQQRDVTSTGMADSANVAIGSMN